MDERVKKKISKIVNGKLAAGELDSLLRFLEHNAPQAEGEEREGFFKHLAREMRQEIKELAALIIEFKRDLASKVQPGISEVRAKYIPQATDQLEEIIAATEKAANKIMDNLESMERQTEEAKEMISNIKQGLASGGSGLQPFKEEIASVEGGLDASLALIGDSFVQMSFQDLTGQRIKRTIELVNLMEERLKKTLLSFGIKLTEKNRNPELSGEALNSTVERKLSGLSGPQKPGEGMNQADIDKLLASM